MKRWYLVVCILTAWVLGLGLTACGQQAGAKSGKSTVTVHGSVIASNGAFTIRSEGKTFQLAGQDLSSMVGKMVKATGTVSEEGGKTILTVTSVQ